MYKFACIFGILALLGGPCMGATMRATTRAAENTAAARTANPAAGYRYNYMYPYLNNQMKTELNPGVTTSQSTSPINAIVKTEKLSAPRRVVSRPSRTAPGTTMSANSARSTTASTTMATPAARSATAAQSGTGGANRRVVARSSTRQNTAVSNFGNRDNSSYLNRAAANTIPTTLQTTSISSARCLADYTECMNGYCQRENTKYNRCYCSAKLSQIDAEYKPAIDSLIKQIISLQGINKWSAAEMNEYWMSTIGKYTGGNSWENIDAALDIDWSSMESRVRGQQAFSTGHEYCVQHLRGCYYMAANLRDAYRSDIARDCAAYEQSLQQIKNAAESIIESSK